MRDNVRLIETSATRRYAGSFLLDDLQIDVRARSIRRRRIRRSPTGSSVLTGRSRAGTRGALRRAVHGRAAGADEGGDRGLKRIRAAHPDFVILNGDIVDTGYRRTSRWPRAPGGRRLRPREGGRAAESGPKRCRTTCRQPRVVRDRQLERVEGAVRRALSVLRPQGRALILLNSTRGTLRGSDWDQLPMPRARCTARRRTRRSRTSSCRAPPDQGSGPDRGEPARRPQRGGADRAPAERLRRDDRKGRGAHGLPRPDRQRAPGRRRPVHGVAVVGQVTLRHAGPRRLTGWVRSASTRAPRIAGCAPTCARSRSRSRSRDRTRW